MEIVTYFKYPRIRYRKRMKECDMMNPDTVHTVTVFRRWAQPSLLSNGYQGKAAGA
jgi:hypothetical protein